MRIFITGASGFIGNELLAHLSSHTLLLNFRKDVQTLTSKNISFLMDDLVNLACWEKQLTDFQPEACIHLAWDGLPDYSLQTCLQNFNLNIKLFDLLGRIGCRKIFVAGTCWEYGDLQGLVSETDVATNLNIFPSFKKSICTIGKSLASQYGFDFIWGRIFFAYGAGQRKSSLIPYCVESLQNNIVPDLKNPSAVNDFIHVSDVAESLKSLIETPEVSGLFNIATGKPHKVSEVVRIVARILGKEHLIHIQDDLPAGDGFWGDTSLLEQKTGFLPAVSLVDGISQTVDGIAA